MAFARRVYSEKITGEDRQLQETASPESLARWAAFAKSDIGLDPTDADHQNVLRFALLDFIADFANWNNSTVPAYLETSRALTQAAHEALGGAPGTRPLVVDPFAGGGSIPLEALRVGADVFASDLNPIPVILNKVILDYVPKYGERLITAVKKWAGWLQQRAEEELAFLYPLDSSRTKPIAYLWARTVRCEGPECGAEIPLIRSSCIAQRGKQSIYLAPCCGREKKQIRFDIVCDGKTGGAELGILRRSSATCPICGFTTSAGNVRSQFTGRKGGVADAPFSPWSQRTRTIRGGPIGCHSRTITLRWRVRSPFLKHLGELRPKMFQTSRFRTCEAFSISNCSIRRNGVTCSRPVSLHP